MAQGPDPCVGPSVNPIACENSKTGNPSSEWEVTGAGSTSIQGFATEMSVNRGQTIGFKVDLAGTSYRIDIYRLGYYAGLGARKIATLNPTASLAQNQPNCLTDGTTGLVDCGNWKLSSSWAVPATATSGVYIARLVRTDGTTGASHVPFVVRDDDGHSDLLFQTSDPTWHAYNQYGGNSLYVGAPAGRAFMVSYNRPITTRGTTPEDYLFNAEYPMIRFLEANGYNVSYFSGVDTDRRGVEILEHKAFLSNGHDEYWSGDQRANVEAARDAGVNLAFFSANEVFWKTRWENSIDGSSTPFRTLVTYKETHANAKIDPSPEWTGTWRDPRFSPPSDGGRPENSLTGTIFTVNCCTYAIRVPAAHGKMRFWRNTTVATQAANQTATLAANTLGYEWDEDLDNGFRPGGLIRLSSTTQDVPEKLLDHGSSYGPGTAVHALTMYRAPSGARVFGAGTVQWAWGLDSTHDRGNAAADVRMRQATVNLFADFGAQPSSLQSGLVAATASNDTVAPTTVITSPASGATIAAGTAVTISGTATDTGGIVAGIEVSTDGGLTWRQATGTTSWSYSWFAAGSGTVNLRSRGIDDSGNIEATNAGINITIPSAAPGSGIVAAFNFNEGTGSTVADLSGRGNNGTLSNATWTTAGKNGNALSFNGTNAWVTVADAASLDLTTAMTLEAWVRPAAVTNWRTAIMKEIPGELSYALYASDSAHPAAWIRTGGASVDSTGPTGLVVNTWTHLAATYDGSVLRMYVNGTQVASRTVGGALATSANPLRIGGNAIWGEYFNGQIDDVRIYSRTLSPSEITTDMNTPVGASGPTVTATSPAASATNVALAANVTATFGGAMTASTIDGTTFLLTDAASQAVPAAVTYNAATLTATLNPTSDLVAGGTYTATVRGGTTDPRVKDSGGNALVSSVVWTFSTVGAPPPGDTTPPTVTSMSPAAGSTNATPQTSVTATFNEALDPATVSSATFELRTAANAVVPAAISYDSATRTATLQPLAALAPTSTYTATVRGGTTDPRVKDAAGNALAASVVWSFTTAAIQPSEGPGGPILVVSSAANPFTRYYAEILRAEGLNLFTVADIGTVDAATLNGYDVVILGEIPLSAAQVTLFSNWVTAGGNLIAMRPDKQLASLLGLTDASATLANQYLLIGSTGPGAGLVTQTIQFHGTADRYTLNGATNVATLYSNATTATTNPAVSLRNVGASGGQAAAFTFDLARSIVYTRQGNPAWAGQERDGAAPIRSDDLFFGAASFDNQPDWVNLSKASIPQADEQQRLLVNLILQMGLDRKPLPRFWFLPRGLKAAVVMTGDDHANGGTAGRWDAYKAARPANCSVADWECIRATSYVYPNAPLTDTQAAAYNAQGFETALHITTACGDYTPASFQSLYDTQLAAFTSKYGSVPVPATNRTHCIAWSDWATQPKVERTHGVRLDTTYYYWPGTWIVDRPGFMTGSGMPMRFADVDGTTLDVYQAATQMTDESDQTYPMTINTLLDNAIGATGYYGVFVANMHTDQVASTGSDAIVASAIARGIPVVSARQMLTWLDGRNGSAFSSIAWNGTTLTFTVAPAAGANGLQALLPSQTSGGTLVSVTVGATPVAFTTQTIKGMSYGVFTAAAGNYTAVYSSVGLPDTAITASPANPTTSTSAAFSFTATPPAGATFQCALDGAGFTACTSGQSYSGLALGSHTFQVRAGNGSGNDATPASFTWTINPSVAPDTTITGSPSNPTTSTSASFTFTANPAFGATFQCALDASGFGPCTSPQAYSTLAAGSHTFQVRGVNSVGTDNTPAAFTWTINAPAPGVGLVAAYGFEEGSGTTTADSSSFGNNGTIANATWSTAGKYGRALSFNGTNAMVTIADAASLDLTTAMTIEAWVNPSAVSNWRTLVLKETTNGLVYSLYGHDGSRPATYVRIGATEQGLAGNASLPANTWTHVAATYDGTRLRMFINGAEVTSLALTGSLATSNNPLRIGGNSIWGEYFAGLIDEVRIYSRALTAAEITTDMNTSVR